MSKNIIVIAGSIAALVLIVAEVYWADWVVQSIFNKDFSNWAIFGALVLIALVTPKALHGIITLSLVLSTLFIWTAM
jgi:hypothetical protein